MKTLKSAPLIFSLACCIALSFFACAAPEKKEVLLPYEGYDLKTYVKPVFGGAVVYNESVMAVKEKDGSIPDIDLLYPIDEIVSVRSASLETEYEAGRDYELKDGRLAIPEGSRIPAFAHGEYYLDEPVPGLPFPRVGGGYLYFGEADTFHKMQLAVTYRHSAKWEGFSQPFAGEQLPKTMAKLENGELLKIMFIGDSITTGANSSGVVGAKPGAPGWPEMSAAALREVYGKNVSHENFAVGGTIASWGAMETGIRAPESKPDLLVIAFGMNDGSFRRAVDDYIYDIETMIGCARQANPDCEILLISTMLANPEAEWYPGTQEEYEPALLNLAGDGIAVARMTEVHRAVLARKRYFDMTGNNINHPNDFLARLYAQTLLAALIEDPGAPYLSSK